MKVKVMKSSDSGSNVFLKSLTTIAELSEVIIFFLFVAAAAAMPFRKSTMWLRTALK